MDKESGDGAHSADDSPSKVPDGDEDDDDDENLEEGFSNMQQVKNKFNSKFGSTKIIFSKQELQNLKDNNQDNAYIKADSSSDEDIEEGFSNM